MGTMAFLDLQNDLYLEPNYLYGPVRPLGYVSSLSKGPVTLNKYSEGITSLRRMESLALRGIEVTWALDGHAKPQESIG